MLSENIHLILKHFDIVFVYMDDIIVFTSSLQELLVHLMRLLKAFDDKQLRIKKGKCELFKEEVNFLGHVI